MAVKLNRTAYEHAKRLIERCQFIDDEREAWSDDHPSTQTENEFIEKNISVIKVMVNRIFKITANT